MSSLSLAQLDAQIMRAEHELVSARTRALSALLPSTSARKRLHIAALRYQRNSLIPLHRLPPELLIAILTFFHLASVGMYLVPWTLHYYRQAPLEEPLHRVARVCKRWRSAALQCDQLVSAALDPLDARALLRRSAGTPLHVTGRIDDPRTAAEILVHTRRLRSMYLHATQQLDAVLGIFEELGRNAPHLVALSLDRTDGARSKSVCSSTFLEGMANLRELDLTNADFDWDSLVLTPRLESFSYQRSIRRSVSIHQVISAISQRCPQLRALRIEDITPISSAEEPTHLVPVRFPCLERLSICSNDTAPTIWTLLSAFDCSLAHLCIRDPLALSPSPDVTSVPDLVPGLGSVDTAFLTGGTGLPWSGWRLVCTAGDANFDATTWTAHGFNPRPDAGTTPRLPLHTPVLRPRVVLDLQLPKMCTHVFAEIAAFVPNVTTLYISTSELEYARFTSSAGACIALLEPWAGLRRLVHLDASPAGNVNLALLEALALEQEEAVAVPSGLDQRGAGRVTARLVPLLERLGLHGLAKHGGKIAAGERSSVMTLSEFASKVEPVVKTRRALRTLVVAGHDDVATAAYGKAARERLQRFGLDVRSP